jgi:phosphohistidine phosphatase
MTPPDQHSPDQQDARILLILRHAKSDWGTGLLDHERPLNARGRRATKALGRFLARSGHLPDSCLSSTAIRARTTAERTAAAAGIADRPLRLERALYESSPDLVLDLVRETPAEVSRLLVVGHEPTFSALVAEIVGGARLSFPTGALAAVRFAPGSWEQVGPGRGELLFFVTPRLLD